MRGRGRGRRRGGGRGRGRGGRGWSRGGRRSNTPPRDGTSASHDGNKKDWNIEDYPETFFTGTTSTEDHLKAQNDNRIRYSAALSVLLETGIQVTQNARIRALAMAWARGDVELASAFLQCRSQFGLVEVLKALTMLDAGRQVRVLEKRFKCLQLSAQKVKPQKMGKLKSDIDNMTKLKPPAGSASGAVCKHVSKWVRTFTAEQLEFYAIHFPKDSWKKLADICHLNPKKDFPEAPWFLPYCFGNEELPEGSLVQICHDLKEATVNDLVKEYDIPFSVVKQFTSVLTAESKKRIAEYETKLDTVIWYYEDLKCPEVDEVLSQRLAKGDPITLPNGKLLERLLTILLLRHPSLNNARYAKFDDEVDKDLNHNVHFFSRLIEVAEPRLTSIKLPLESPIVVIGDASGSMDVAIRTSTIIASLLTAICSARLVFFNNENREAPFLPKNVKEMLKLAVTTVASGGTTPAASLYPFYEKKEVVKTFIIVTDEEENGAVQNYRFAKLFKKYHEEVFPARLVFVSFLRSQHADGQMVRDLKALDIHPTQLRLESSRPDLSKLDNMFGKLSAVTESFQEKLAATEASVKSNGVEKVFEQLKSLKQEEGN